MTGLRGDATVSAVRGDVALAIEGGANATAVNGAIDLRLSPAAAAHAQRLHTVNGPIRLTLPRGANVTVSASSIGGTIRGERGFALATNDGTYVGHSGSAILGSGAAHISLGTVAGDIVVAYD